MTHANERRWSISDQGCNLKSTHNEPNRRSFPRRHFLRSTAGGILALPWLESLARDSGLNATPPQRYAFIYTPNGYNQETFLPKSDSFISTENLSGNGNKESGATEFILPPALTPLEPIRNHFSLLSGLDREFVPGTGVHAQCGSCWLTSSAPQETLDGGFPTNITLDQLLARHLGNATPLPSLELSCNDFTNRKETKYFECISWYGPGHAAQTEKNPRTAFNRLFGRPDGDVLNQSVLDNLQGSAARLSSRLSSSDRIKLEEYLESVRQTERRIQAAERASKRIAEAPFPEPSGIPSRRDDYLRLMGDLIVHAFRLDLTRVATLLVDPERWDSPRMFDGIFDTPQNHHVLTHTKGDEAKAKITEIDRYHVRLFAYVVKQLASMPEGDGTLLDRCCIVMGTGISDGDKHNYADLQVLLAGGLLRQVGFRQYAGRRPLADLWLTLAQRANLKLDRFADSTGALSDV